MKAFLFVAAAMVLAAAAGCAQVETPAKDRNASTPAAKPVLEEPTLRSLGAYWIIKGDENGNARVEMTYRKAGSEEWKRGADLFRVEKNAQTQSKRQLPGQRAHEAELDPPDDCRLFAGSLLLLDPDTEYDIRLRLVDPDGGDVTETLKSRTIAEPVAPKPERTLHVVPGAGSPSTALGTSGTGTEADPFKGFASAEFASKPGDLILVHAGTYNETLHMTECGLPGKPVIWRAAPGEAPVIDGKDQLRFGIQAWLIHDVWFEGFTIKGVAVGISANDSHHVVIRRNHVLPSMYGICFNGNQTGKVSRFWVSDNLIEGPCTWPRHKGVEDPGGMYLSGRGHEVCYNRVHHFADGIDTYNSRACAAIDVHNNDISECTDDGSEMDFSERNTRNYMNRYTNVFQGVSEQPIFGGPTYIFRNTLYNVGLEPFKLHHNGTPKSEVNWAPSGAVFFHNTILRAGVPWLVWSQGPVYNCVSRNNLFVGTKGNWAMELTCEMVGCDFDYDGFAGSRLGPNEAPVGTAGAFERFLRWNGVEYSSLDDVRKRAPAERHALQLVAEDVFASGLLPAAHEDPPYPNTTQDFRLNPKSAAVDAGAILPGLNDGFKGKAPDLGALELGDDPPHYGPRP